MEGKNSVERRDIERLEASIRDANNISNKNFQDISRLRDIQNARDLENRGFQAKISTMERDLDQSQNRIGTLTSVKEQKEDDIASVSLKISQAQQQILQVRASIQKLDNEIQYHEQSNEKNQQTQARLSKLTEQEYFKGKEFAGVEAEKRTVLIAREDECEGLKYDIDSVKQCNGKYAED